MQQTVDWGGVGVGLVLRCHSPALINNARVPRRSEKSSLSRTRRLITTFIPRNLSLGTPPHCQAEVASAQEHGSGNLCLPVRGGGLGKQHLSQPTRSPGRRVPGSGSRRRGRRAGCCLGAEPRSALPGSDHPSLLSANSKHARKHLPFFCPPSVSQAFVGKKERGKEKEKKERGRQAAANPCAERLPAAAAAAACICVCVCVRARSGSTALLAMHRLSRRSTVMCESRCVYPWKRKTRGETSQPHTRLCTAWGGRGGGAQRSPAQPPEELLATTAAGHREPPACSLAAPQPLLFAPAFPSRSQGRSFRKDSSGHLFPGTSLHPCRSDTRESN